MEIELYVLEAEENMKKAIDNLKANLSKLAIGRANPNILDSIKIEYYDEFSPIRNLANITIPEPRQLLIKPYEKELVKKMIKVINSSSLGFTAQDEGHQLRIVIPETTTERRKDMVKQIASMLEQSKIQIRGSRQHVNKMIKNDKELSEDQEEYYHEEIQELTNKYIDIVNSIAKEKEKELMTM